MTPETTTATPGPESLPLCSNVTPTGRHCRQPVIHAGSQFCRTHTRIRRPRQIEANPLTDLSSELSGFSSYADVTNFLARVLTLLAENRISPRRAAVLSYLANSIVNTLRAAERQALLQAKNEPETLQIDWSSMSRIEPDVPGLTEQQAHPAATISSTSISPQTASVQTLSLAPDSADTDSSTPIVSSPSNSAARPVSAPPQPPLNPPAALFYSPQPPRPVSPIGSRHRRLHWENQRSG